MRRKIWYELFVDMIRDMAKLSRQPIPLDLSPKDELLAAIKVFASFRQLPGVREMMSADTASLDDMLSTVKTVTDYCLGYGGRVYKVAARFGEHLARTNLDVKTEHFPAEFGRIYVIEFPDNVVFKGSKGECWRTAIVGVGAYVPGGAPRVYVGSEPPPDMKSKMLNISLPDYNEDGTLQHGVNTFMNFPLTETTVYECAKLIESMRGQSLIATKEVIDYVVKCVLYIESGEPDLTDENGTWTPTKKPKKQRQQRENFCPFDVVNVGYSFHERMRHVDSTTVVGHFRWQPCGPLRAQVKLIWIDEHDRHFNKENL